MFPRLFSRKNIVILIILAAAIVGFFVINYFFPFISADTDPTTGVELIQKGNFEVIPTFDESIWEKITNNSKNTSVAVIDKRLVVEEKSDIADNYITIDQKFPLKKGKLYKVTINFETDFPEKLTIIGGVRTATISSVGKVTGYSNLQNRRLQATDNNKPTTFTSYISPLKDQDTSQFFLTVNGGSGKIKIKKISVVECDRSEIGGIFPDIISRFWSGVTLVETFCKSIPWRLGDPNSTDGTATGVAATTSEKALIFSADVDSQDLNYRPTSDH